MLRRPTEHRAVMTVLFTDIVGSTEATALVGDRHWKELLRRHHAAVRAALRAHRGREVDTAGDGFFAVFQQPGDAIRCAVAARESVAAHGLRIRAGIHTGEVEPMGRKVGGLAVVVAARVLASCDPGQIRVTSTVRDLTIGSGFGFGDAGTRELKGVPGEWRLFALTVEAPEPAPLVKEQLEAKPARRGRLIGLGVAGAAVVIGGLAALAILFWLPSGASGAAGPNTVIAFDPAQQKVIDAVNVGSGPSLLASDGAGLWVASETAKTLTRVDLKTGEDSSVGLAGVPTGLAVSGGTTYVTHAFKHSIERFAAETGAGATSLDGIVVRRLVFDGRDGWGIDPLAAAAIHLAPGRDAESISLEDGTGASDLAAGLDAIWVANAIGQNVTRIDPKSGDQVIINVSDPPTSITTSDAAVWVASETRDSLVKIDPQTHALASVGVCDAPVDLSSSGSDVWVACAGSHQLVLVTGDGKVAKEVPLPATPSAVLVIDGIVWLALRSN